MKVDQAVLFLKLRIEQKHDVQLFKRFLQMIHSYLVYKQIHIANRSQHKAYERLLHIVLIIQKSLIQREIRLGQVFLELRSVHILKETKRYNSHRRLPKIHELKQERVETLHLQQRDKKKLRSKSKVFPSQEQR